MSNLFELDNPQGKRIVVAMSGGVDSSVVAALAAQSGADVIGVTLRLYDDSAAPRRAGSCCAGQDVRDARAVADRLGIQHHVHDVASRFREDVIDRFADEYVTGRTPIPCVQCNMGVKFSDLLSLARELGADCLATGHYVRRIGNELHRAVDPARDQSYFLFQTTSEQLDYLRFPLGGMEKPEVRRLAQEAGLIVARKPDSQDICFVPDGDYAGLVHKLRPEAARSGEIVDLDGRVLGAHGGIAGFTIGQRRGLEIGGLAKPLYVVKLDAAANRVIVGPRSALAVDAARLSGLNLIGPEPSETLSVKVRSLAKPVPARLEGDQLIFAAPEYSVAPGQAAVFYAGTRCWGGGWIEETVASDARLAA